MWAPPPPPEFMGKVLFMVIGQDVWEIANHATASHVVMGFMCEFPEVDIKRCSRRVLVSFYL